MRQRLELLHKESANMTLRDDERQHLRDLLIDHIDKNPVQEKERALSYEAHTAKSRTIIFKLTVLILIVLLGVLAYSVVRSW